MDEIFIKEIQDQKYQVHLKKIIDFFDNILKYGQHIMFQINIKHGSSYADSVLVLLLREALEIMDGIKSLYKGSSINLSVILMRNLFEVMIYFDYIFSEENLIEKRALSYEVDYINKKIKLYKKLKENSPELNAFDDGVKKEIQEDIDKKIQNLELMFQKYDQYKEVNNDRESKKKKINKNRGNRKIEPMWYQIYSDAKNIRELCKILNMEEFYLIIYKSWSAKVHPAIAMQGIDIVDSNANLRNPKIPNTEEVASNLGMVLTFMSTIYTYLVKYYLNKDEQKRMLQWHSKMRNREKELGRIWRNIRYKHK